MHIRIATIADIPLIKKVTEEVWPQTYMPILGEEQVDYMLNLFYSADSLSKQMLESGHKFIIGLEEEQPVAFASYSEIEPKIFKLHKLYVLPGRQGKGNGKLMLKYVIDDVKKMHGVALRLNVNRYNHTAIAFYKRTGFTHLKDEDIDIGGGYFMNDYELQLII